MLNPLKKPSIRLSLRRCISRRRRRRCSPRRRWCRRRQRRNPPNGPHGRARHHIHQSPCDGAAAHAAGSAGRGGGGLPGGARRCFCLRRPHGLGPPILQQLHLATHRITALRTGDDKPRGRQRSEHVAYDLFSEDGAGHCPRLGSVAYLSWRKVSCSVAVCSGDTYSPSSCTNTLLRLFRANQTLPACLLREKPLPDAASSGDKITWEEEEDCTGRHHTRFR